MILCGVLGRVLIETLWNVNFTKDTAFPRSVWVLIETLWNVNTGRYVSCDYGTQVLIETLWNVNYEVKVKRAELRRFNRNIVECKFYFFGRPVIVKISFNRNIVECK